MKNKILVFAAASLSSFVFLNAEIVAIYREAHDQCVAEAAKEKENCETGYQVPHDIDMANLAAAALIVTSPDVLIGIKLQMDKKIKDLEVNLKICQQNYEDAIKKCPPIWEEDSEGNWYKVEV